jgi:ABC-2 type transport system ATP-binding protein
MRRKAAVARAHVILEQVGLTEATRAPVGTYSHGMQKRLSVGRALLTAPSLLLVDEATHDLDPLGAHEARELVRELAAGGTAVIWATQRLDEIRGFADGVTLLDHGQVRFSGTVPELMMHAVPRRYLLRVRNGRSGGPGLRSRLEAILEGTAVVAAPRGDDAEHYLVTLAPDVILGEALASLRDGHIQVLACREERSEIEEAFLALTGTREP